jgi:hypothetical protein
MMTKLPDGMASRCKRTMIPEDKRPPSDNPRGCAEYDDLTAAWFGGRRPARPFGDRAILSASQR